MTDGADIWEFTYDGNGLRTKRYNPYNPTGDYTYQYDSSGKLVSMYCCSSPLYFTYDPITGFPLSLTCGDGTYYYITNSRGDVLGITDSQGNLCLAYEYDAWGNVINYEGYSSLYYISYNPLLYRGYVYDWETGLYYLQSRYYDPEIGRFINADAYAATGQGLVGNNMFAYCYNRPVVLTDSMGTRPIASMTLSTETVEERKASCAYMRGLTSPYCDNSLNVAEVAKELAISFWNNLEFSVGAGQGIYGEVDILDLASLQIGIYGNYVSLQLEDGKFSFGQEFNQGISVSLFGHNFGASEYSFIQNGVTTIDQKNIGFYTDDTWTIFSVAIYPTAGASLRFGFDIVQFLDDMDRIFV